MKRRNFTVVGTAVLFATISACTPAPEAPRSRAPTSAIPSSSSATPEATPTTSASPEATDQVVGTVVRFTSDRTSIDVTIDEDNPAVRDLLTMLPLELPIEEFDGSEKIASLPRELNHAGSPGSDPEDGDLIYYTPWGNLGFYYDTAGIGYSDATLHIGTYAATEEQLSLLEGGTVTIEIVD